MAVIYLIWIGAHLILGGEMLAFTMVREVLRLISLYLPASRASATGGSASPRRASKLNPSLVTVSGLECLQEHAER